MEKQKERIWTLIRNDERYTPNDTEKRKNPKSILINGTLMQARNVAQKLCEPGCDYYYYICGADDE